MRTQFCWIRTTCAMTCEKFFTFQMVLSLFRTDHQICIRCIQSGPFINIDGSSYGDPKEQKRLV